MRDEKHLTPQQKLELVQGMLKAKDVKKYAAEMGVDRSYLYELRREMERTMLEAWSQKNVGRPPAEAVAPEVAELKAKVEQLEEEAKVWELNARVGEYVLEALKDEGLIKKTDSARPFFWKD